MFKLVATMKKKKKKKKNNFLVFTLVSNLFKFSTQKKKKLFKFLLQNITLEEH